MTGRAALALLLAAAGSAIAAPPAPSTAQLSAVVRDMVVRSLPDPVVSAEDNWNHTRLAMHKLSWRASDGTPRLKLEKSPKYHGHWKRVTVTAVDPAHTLQLALTDPVAAGPPDTVVFDACMLCPMKVRFEQQVWNNGLRVYSGETRARLTAALRLRCELTFRLEGKGFFPEAVFRVRAVAAELNYTDLVVEHTAGIGGDGAKLVGELLVGTIRKVKPSLERDLLARANAAIVKHGDSKEVRLGFTQFLKGAAKPGR
jgi:hypothetical protein